jgi:hypothetical protein
MTLFFFSETNIDFLMEVALDKVAYLPFSLIVDLVSIKFSNGLPAKMR